MAPPRSSRINPVQKDHCPQTPHLILGLCLSQHYRHVFGKVGQIVAAEGEVDSLYVPLLSSLFSRIHWWKFMSMSSRELRAAFGAGACG